MLSMLLLIAEWTPVSCLGDSKGLLRNCRSYINQGGVVQDGQAEKVVAVTIELPSRLIAVV